jgi:nitrite reductase (NADH) small subunit
MSRYKLGAASQIPAGEGRAFQVGDAKIAVFRTHGGAVYATQAECPHRKGPLADGLVGGSTLICPLHEWAFELGTGRALNGACELRTFPIEEEDGSLFVMVSGASNGAGTP